MQGAHDTGGLVSHLPAFLGLSPISLLLSSLLPAFFAHFPSSLLAFFILPTLYMFALWYIYFIVGVTIFLPKYRNKSNWKIDLNDFF